MDIWCSIYKHPKKEGMFIYIKKDMPLEELPEELRKQFIEPIHVMDILLTPARKLAREDVHKVLQNLQSRGFHIQLPPLTIITS